MSIELKNWYDNSKIGGAIEETLDHLQAGWGGDLWFWEPLKVTKMIIVKRLVRTELTSYDFRTFELAGRL